MAEEAVYSQKTFGQVSNDIETAETTATETTTESATTETTPAWQPETATTSVATTTEPAETTEAVTTTEEKKENVSEFSLEGEVIADTAQTQQATIEVKPTFNFDEELRKVDRKEVLKKLGLNDFSLQMDEYLAKGGKAEDFIIQRGIDYNQISDEALIKSELKKQYPNFTPDKIDKFFNAKYGVSELDTDDVKEQKELQLEADGYLKRQQKIAEQQNFKIPDTPILHTDAAYEQWKSEQESRPKLVENARNYFANHEATKALHESKRVTISLGKDVEPFNFNIDKPELITQSLTDDGGTWSKLTSTATGEPDVPKQQLITMFAFNPQKFVQDIFNYGMQMGERKPLVEGQNAQKPQAKVASMTNTEGQTVTVKKFGQVAQ